MAVSSRRVVRVGGGLWSADAAVWSLACLVVLGWILGSYLGELGLLRIHTHPELEIGRHVCQGLI